MTKAFFTYFLHYIFHSKTRQGPLILAILGLTLSSFSLFVLQSTMGGLQKNLIDRSKNVCGYGEIDLWTQPNLKEVTKIVETLSKLGINSYPEFELEVLIKNGENLSAGKVHGLEDSFLVPSFLNLENNQPIPTTLGGDLIYKIQAMKNQKIELIAPGYTQNFLQEVPRSVSVFVQDRVYTQVPEVDLFHLWTKASIVNNLTRSKTFNRIRLISPIHENNKKVLMEQALYELCGDSFRILTWEEKNQSLVWALKLETTVMTFLFIVMSLLVSLSITTGLLIFSDKIKTDLASFWILGGNPQELKSKSLLFLLSIGPITTLVGIFFAFILLSILKEFSFDIMPSVFVERSIPVQMSMRGFLISFFTPVLISSLFSLLAFKNFVHKTSSYLRLIRSVGS